jgi:hypothetical protein
MDSTSSEVVIAKGSSLSLYVVSIVVFSLVFIVGLFLAFKNFRNVSQRARHDHFIKQYAKILKKILDPISMDDAVQLVESFQENEKKEKKNSLVIFLADENGKPVTKMEKEFKFKSKLVSGFFTSENGGFADFLPSKNLYLVLAYPFEE